MGFGQPVRTALHFDITDRERLDFSPLAPDQRNHGPVGAEVLHRWPIWRWRSLAFQPFSFSRLFGDVRSASGLGVSPHGGFIQLDAPEEGDVGDRLLERHLGAQSSHTLGQRGAQLAW
jgi:hypothetical protein